MILDRRIRILYYPRLVTDNLLGCLKQEVFFSDKDFYNHKGTEKNSALEGVDHFELLLGHYLLQEISNCL